MRITLVTESFAPDPGPTASMCRELVVQLRAAGHHVSVITGGRGMDTFGGAQVIRLPRLASIAEIRHLLRPLHPDVVHLIDPHRIGLKVADAADQLGIRALVVDPRDWQPGVDAGRHRPELRDPELHDHWAAARATGPTEERPEAGDDAGRCVVGYSGRLDHRKVLARLTLIAGLPSVRLVVLGDGPGARRLRAAGAKVFAVTGDAEHARCLASLDVLVQPRKREAYSPVVQQALVSGVPVVGFAVGAMSRLVVPEYTGLLVPGDRGKRALARAVARLADEPDLRQTMAEQARESARHRTWPIAAAALVRDHYAPVTSRTRPVAV